MTTYVTFNPSKTAVFSFKATLDKQVYNITVTWSLFGCRYYINIFNQAGVRIVSVPLVGTPLGYDLLSITNANNIAVATTTAPHTYTIGSIVPLVISGCTPSGYNGMYNCSILTSTTFSFSINQILENAVGLGQVNYNLSLTAGYFASTLTYFPDNQQFVINP